jgi:hypothetical protein
MKSGDAPPVKSLSTPLVSNKSASVLFPPDLPTLNDSNKKSPALNVSSAADMSANPVKEEKSSRVIISEMVTHGEVQLGRVLVT